MKTVLILISCVFVLVAFTPYNVVTKHTISAATPIVNVKGLSGDVTLISNATSCTVFRNMTTTARTVAGEGIPLVANTPYNVTLPTTSILSFTCATSAGNRAVKVVR